MKSDTSANSALDATTSAQESQNGGTLGSTRKIPCDIYIVGLGILNIDQLTREAERALKAANEVLYVEIGIGVQSFLTQCCSRVTDLTSLYVENGDRLNTYHSMAARVIEAALDRAPVAFALYGHPTILAYPPFLVHEMARLLDMRVRVIPGISAMDCMFAELMVDPGTNGLQMYEATDLLLRRRPLQADVPVLVWQIGSVETALYSNEPSNPTRFERLRSYLLDYYPAQHRVYAVHCSSYPLMPSTTYAFTLGDICEYASRINSGFSLYIPPTSVRPVVDLKLAEDIVDISHLEKVTHS